MRVIHIIPSAFEYFTDIRSQAFQLIEGLYAMGVDTEAFTVQYGYPDKGMKAEVQKDSPSVHTYMGSTGQQGLIDHLSNFDIVHLHAPFLGAAKQIIEWKKAHPDKSLIITVHRDVPWTDFFSLFVKLYNHFYLPKLFARADLIIADNLKKLQSFRASAYIGADNHVAILDEIELDKLKKKHELNESELVAAKTVLLYNSLVSQ